MDQLAFDEPMLRYPSCSPFRIRTKHLKGERDHALEHVVRGPLGRRPLAIRDQGGRMYIDDYLRLLLQEMRENSTYSTSHNAWVISGLNAQIAFFEHVDQLPPELACVQDVLEEGERRGLWKIDLVPESGTDIVAMK